MNKVLLLSMPYVALGRQALGLSLLKAKLNASGVSCDIRYLSFLLADMVGYEDYAWVTTQLPYTAFAGDWSFTSALYGERPDADSAYIEDVLRNTWRFSDSDIERLLQVRTHLPAFLEACMAAVPWGEYAIVGFTSTFEQNIASLALARRIKAAYPDIVVVFGGANWEGDMGRELLRQFPFVDYACSGEAENSFSALVARIFGEGNTEQEHASAPIPGVIFRSGQDVILPDMANMIRDLDELPFPDYTDYFRDLQQSAVADSVVTTILFETSRGCWWGAKSHCTFCGLNGGAMAFRSKSPRRALDELEYLVERWGIDRVEAVDNILDMKYFNNVMPALAQAGRPIHLFYEVKANLSRKQIKLLHDAGVRRIQPGLESLSNHVLKLMRKGTLALRNIQLLKWCREYGIWVDWNILYGFPGETREDYDETLQLLRAIRFLQPPGACGPIRLDRFSPYFEAPDEFGLVNVRPMKPYQYLYPFDATSQSKIAYYFEYDYAPDVDPTGNAAEVIAYVRWWQQAPQQGALYAIPWTDNALVLLDTRPEAARRELVLSGLERSAYEFCDEMHSVSAVCQYLREEFPQATIIEDRVRGFLDSLVANHLMVTDGTYYLSLAIRSPGSAQSDEPAKPIHSSQEQETGPGISPLSSYLRPELRVLQMSSTSDR